MRGYFIKIMKPVLLTLGLISAIGLSTEVLAEELNYRQYSEASILYNMRSRHGKAAKACLQSWGNTHPFKNKGRLRFRVIDNNVKLFGMGDDVKDNVRTSYPQMILVQPAVNVMGKMVYDLS